METLQYICCLHLVVGKMRLLGGGLLRARYFYILIINKDDNRSANIAKQKELVLEPCKILTPTFVFTKSKEPFMSL